MPVHIIGSPCQGVCRQHPTYKVCKGCYRTLLEIRAWPNADPTIKLAILDNCEKREKLYGDIKDKDAN
jgi:uncharacterized protein